jgi:hypothetical protein
MHNETGIEWKGAYQLRSFLEECWDRVYKGVWRDKSGIGKKGIYVVSAKPWQGIPTLAAEAVYVGRVIAKKLNKKKAYRFKTRIGECVAGMLGFPLGHHINRYLKEYLEKNGNIRPLDLYFGWAEGVACTACAELEAFDALQPWYALHSSWALKSKKKKLWPGKCKEHKSGPVVSCFPVQASGSC